jgi:hypothetical protein
VRLVGVGVGGLGAGGSTSQLSLPPGDS